ncbi:MAG: SpoIID/LytB domain-containing protein [Patescibacteria group bacterium]
MAKRLFLFIFCVFLLLPIIFFAKADELDDITKQLDSLKKDLQDKESNFQNLNNQLNEIKAKVTFVESEIVKKEEEVRIGEEALAFQRGLLNERARSYYKNINKNAISIVNLLTAENLSDSLQNFFYQKTLVDQDRNTITRIVLYIRDLETKKEELKSEKSRLAVINEEVDRQTQALAGEITTTKGKIAELSAKQQEIINARSGSFTVNIGDSELADDYYASITGFREAAPGGYFGAFSFGAYTHRKGMSQYGALGRAQIGQDHRAILRAYYGKDPENRDTNGNIRVAENGEIDFETTYLYGIAEMPSSWHTEALKAQAIAARTYAYRYKQEGKEICITERCQVFRKSKSDNPPAAWKQAVDDTKGQVLDGVVTFYSSTAGGYLTTSGWDTTDGSGGSNFIDKSYEKTGGSPWVYKSWYTQSYSINSDKCGRSNPWLSPQEMADIINAVMVMHRSGSGADTNRVTPTSSCWGGNPYSIDELRSASQSYGGGINSASGVVVSQGNGTTNQVTFQTDKGEKTMSGAEFKKGYNLRAPGRLSIPQSGFAFFNIEHK